MDDDPSNFLIHGAAPFQYLTLAQLIINYGRHLPQMTDITAILSNLRLVSELSEANRYSEVHRICQQMAKKYSRIDLLWANLGTAKYKSGNLSGAIENNLRSISHFPRSFMLHYNLACYYFEQCDYDKALVMFMRAAKADRPTVYLTKFIQLLQSCLQSYSMDSHFYIGQIHMAWKQYEQAIVTYEIGLMMFPDKTKLSYQTTCNEIGVYYMADGQYTKALQYFAKALEANPTINNLNKETLQHCINIYVVIESYIIADKHCREYFKRYRYDDRTLYHYAVTQYGLKKFDETIALLTCFMDDPNTIDVQILLMTTYLKVYLLNPQQQSTIETVRNINEAHRIAVALEPRLSDMTDTQRRIYLANFEILNRHWMRIQTQR